MGLSILVAKILGLTYLSAGVMALNGKVTHKKIMEDFEKSAGLTFISGFFTLVLGTVLVNYHNIWTNDWTVLITIVGWISLVKGIMLIAFPQFIFNLKSNWYKNTKAWGVAMLALGLLFGYFGFIH